MNIEGPQHIYVRTTVYNKTDFEEMLLMSDYKKALFIFNDNDVDIGTDVSGNDSAKIRVYNTYSKKQIPYPRSAGIPVGYFFEKNGNGGYKGLKEPYNGGELPFKSILVAYIDILAILYECKNVYNTIIYPVKYRNDNIISTDSYKVEFGVVNFISYLLKEIDHYYKIFYNMVERHEQDIPTGGALFYQLIMKDPAIKYKIEVNTSIEMKETQQEIERKRRHRQDKREERERERQRRKEYGYFSDGDMRRIQQMNRQEEMEEEEARKKEEKELLAVQKETTEENDEDDEDETSKKETEIKEDSKKIKKKMKDFLKVMNKYSDSIKDSNKNETKLYKLFITMNTEIMDLPNVYYESSMINKNDQYKYIYVNPYLKFTTETNLYNKTYKIKKKDQEKYKPNIKELLLYNVTEILKRLFKTGTVIYLGKNQKPYVIESYVPLIAVLDENDKDDEDDTATTTATATATAKKKATTTASATTTAKQNATTPAATTPAATTPAIKKTDKNVTFSTDTKKGDASVKQGGAGPSIDDLTSIKTTVFNIIKITNVNNNKTINVTINLKLYPGKTLPSPTSPKFKSYDCLRKKNYVYYKFIDFTGLDDWEKSRGKLAFQENKRTMMSYIDDAVYKQYDESETSKDKDKDKDNKDKEKNTGRERSPFTDRDKEREKEKEKRSKGGSNTRRHTKSKTRTRTIKQKRGSRRIRRIRRSKKRSRTRRHR